MCFIKSLVDLHSFNFIFFISNIHSFQKLIRVNEWHDIPVKGTEDEDALIDFHLFATCEK